MVAPQGMMQGYPVAHHSVILIAPNQAGYNNQGMMQGQQPMMQHYMTPANGQMMNGQPVMMQQMMTQQPHQSGGFVGPQHIIDNIAAAQKANNDSPVELTGNIIASLGNDQYQFKDNSGVITLDISPENFNGLMVTPATTVTIQGEVDKEWGNCIIDVDSVNQA
ncbi:NirD/YgiW/YdeI family stress tolerance protein [Shewanella marina]|uniref:NirD/YgiW/YdeI family stress tolerance protein n=1 Tax=Shewanella marina TaxID=487319 RepID=UPI0004709E7D|nr:NirD/YgiW/YdeI family stress tolerance protein [Shewanella marina]